MSTKKLSSKEDLFCVYYIALRFNGKQAAIKAGYAPKSAEVAASRLLSNDKVKAKIKELEESLLKKIGYTATDILKELALVGMSDIKNYIDFAGDEVVMKSSDMINEYSRAIESIKIVPKILRVPDADGEIQTVLKDSVQFKLHNKIKALELLGKNLELFTERVDHTTNGKDIPTTYNITFVDPDEEDK